MAASIKVVKSRFALLKVEGDDDEIISQKTDQQKQTLNTKSKKKSKKKSNSAKIKVENDELQQMAFGKKASKQKMVSSSNGNHSVSNEQWDAWQKVDKEFTTDSYEHDLQQALLLSKQDEEKENETKKLLKISGFDSNKGDGKDNKKKKRKEKPSTMSLDEFNQRARHGSSDDEPPFDRGEIPPLRQAPNSAEVKFFDDVDIDATKIIRREKIQEEYEKHFAVESVMTAKYTEELSQRDTTISSLENELKQVKKRNKQLCVILAQGEMKDKAEVLLQVEQLTEVNNELTEQVSQLTAELEKERSKVHTMKSELDKVKVGKHAGK